MPGLFAFRIARLPRASAVCLSLMLIFLRQRTFVLYAREIHPSGCSSLQVRSFLPTLRLGSIGERTSSTILSILAVISCNS